MYSKILGLMYGKQSLFGKSKNKEHHHVDVVGKQIYTLQKVLENGKKSVV